MITTEHAVVLDRIREETSQDTVLRKLSQTICKGKWESSKRDADLIPFYQVKEGLYESQGMIFRMEKIILPANLQQKIFKSAHSLGHLARTKTKQMLREKYWLPGMNHLISQTIGSCFDCQVAPKSHRQEPIKPSVIPEEPWEQISTDFGGPYPDGHYNLVAVDQRTRYPVVGAVASTGFKQIEEKLKKTFAYFGIPEQFKDFSLWNFTRNLSLLHIRFKQQKRGTFKNGGRRSACYDFSCLDYGNISAKENDFLSEDATNGLTDEEDATYCCNVDCQSIETRIRIKVVSHFEPRGKLNYDTRVW